MLVVNSFVVLMARGASHPFVLLLLLTLHTVCGLLLNTMPNLLHHQQLNLVLNPVFPLQPQQLHINFLN
jgi:hypothetical protein